MSVQAKAVFAGCCLTSSAIIGYVHYKQAYDRDQLHSGVIRDIERQQRRKIDNAIRLQQQIDFTNKLKKMEKAEE